MSNIQKLDTYSQKKVKPKMITMYCKPNRKKCALPQKVTCQKSAQEDKSQKPVEEVKNMIFNLDKNY